MQPVMMVQQPAPMQQVVPMQQVFAVLPADFVTNLCDCFSDFSSCCDVYFCICCQIGFQKGMISTSRQGMDVFWCCLPIFCGGLGVVMAAVTLRTDVRQRFGLTAEGDCSGCLQGCCCPACSICQTYREMSARGMWPGGVCVSTPFTLPGIAPPPVMMMNAAPSAAPPPGAAGGYVVYNDQKAM